MSPTPRSEPTYPVSTVPVGAVDYGSALLGRQLFGFLEDAVQATDFGAQLRGFTAGFLAFLVQIPARGAQSDKVTHSDAETHDDVYLSF